MPDYSTRTDNHHGSGRARDELSKPAMASKDDHDHDDNIPNDHIKKPIDPRRVLQILECKRKVLEFVESMLEPEVTLDELQAGEELLSRMDYDSIAQERHILKLCGYPLCSNKITKDWKQLYHVSLKDKRIYNVEVRKLYCSVRCMDTSIKYRDEHLSEEPIWMRLVGIRMDPDHIGSPQGGSCQNL